MFFRPHAVTVAPPVKAQTAGGVPAALSWGTAVADTCQITPRKAGTTFDRDGVAVDRAHDLLTDPASAPLYVVGARVTFGSRTFFVVEPAQVFNALGVASNAMAILREEF